MLFRSGFLSPAVLEGIEWSAERSGAPGQLTFKVLEDNKLKISEGNAVRFKYKGKKVFFGFIFSRQTDGGGEVSVTAYDQLRYFKNKETYVFEDKTLTQIIKRIASDFGLRKGSLEDTKYKIPHRVEAEKGGSLCFLGQICLHRKFQASQGYIMRPCLKNGFNKNKEKQIGRAHV